ncbi:MAG: DinB family protein [Chloroflexi bacterium]|jgi:uncharacterized damage-inducible protein DinB|nr:DinB family protein [Chloroflexota bacterium]MBT4072468.1 DinB family protein [Chloroflexota bacterium]MBT4515033.1 DinB family protein [Chloroflexota bacterium]MBT6682986.1 DinB family protein [Chloroflexota bacterium]
MDHRDVARNGLDEILSVLKSTVDGLTPVELYWQPSPSSNHIAWTVWHMSRAEDHWYNRYIGQGDPVWTASDFCTKLRLPAERSGAGDSAELVSEFPKLEMADILDYADAVRAQSLKNLDAVTAEQLSETREGARGEPPTIAWVLGHVLVEQSQHLGQVAYLRGIMRGLGN